MTLLSSDTEAPIYLLGCGGHGRVVLDSLMMSGKRVAGILDASLSRGATVLGVSILGGDEFLEQLSPRDTVLCLGVGVMPGGTKRNGLFELCRGKGFEFASVVHPSAVISNQHEAGQGVQVLAGSVVQAGTRLGDNVILNTRSSVDHDCVIGNHVMVGPGAVVCGQVEIGVAAYIGAGAVLLPGVRIGRKAVVGAGCIVTKDVGDGEKVVGNPARKVNSVRNGNE